MIGSTFARLVLLPWVCQRGTRTRAARGRCSLAGLLLAGLVGGAAAGDAGGPAGTTKAQERIPGEVFSVASGLPYPSEQPDRYHSADFVENLDGVENVGTLAEVAEVGACCGGANEREVRGLAEFPVSSEGGSSATLSFEVLQTGGLFDQPAGDFDILVEAYVGNGQEELADYAVPATGNVGVLGTAGLTAGRRLEFDVSAALVEALRGGGQLGIRLRPSSAPGGAAMLFDTFALTRLADRASIGGSGAVFCPDGTAKLAPSVRRYGGGPKGGCTDPLGPGDRFGTAISVSGNVVAIGVPGDDARGTDAGAVFVFLRDRGQLVYQEQLRVPPQYVTGGFGSALAVAGGVIVVGAPGEPTALRKGATVMRAAIFERLQQGFGFKQPVFSPAARPGSGFGSSLAVEGDLMVIGAPAAGTASVYRFSGGFPDEIGILEPPGGKGFGTGFGRSVAISKGKFAITGGVAGLVAGSVGIFEAVGQNLAALGNMTSDDPDADFGRSVSMEGDNVFVGAPRATFNANGTGGRTGAVFGLAPGGAMRGRFTPPTPTLGGLFGVSLAASRGRLAIGQPGGGPGGKGTAPSRVYLYEATAAALLQVDQVTQQTANEAGLGDSVALDDGNLLAASPGTGTLTGVLDTRRIFSADFEGAGLAPTGPFTFPLAVARLGDGAGTVTSDPAGIDCPGSCGGQFGAATTVALTATPAAGSRFAGWGGDCDGTTSCQVQMLAARSVTARFALLPDLRIDGIGVQQQYVEGTPVIVQPIVQNAGPGPAAASRVTLFLSLDDRLDPSDFRVGDEPVPSLGPQEDSAITFSFTMPDLAPGSYPFFPLIVVDSDEQIEETDEANIFRTTRPQNAVSAGKRLDPAALLRRVPATALEP